MSDMEPEEGVEGGYSSRPPGRPHSPGPREVIVEEVVEHAVADFKARFCQAARERGFTLSDVARTMGVSPQRLSAILGQSRFGLHKLEELAAAIGLTASDFMDAGAEEEVR